MGIFRRKKQPVASEPVQMYPATPVAQDVTPETENTRRKLHEERASLNEIYNTLSGINFDQIAEKMKQHNVTKIVRVKNEGALPGDPEYIETEVAGTTILEEIRKKVVLLLKKLNTVDPAVLVSAETDGIDFELRSLANELSKTLNSETPNFDIAKTCVTGLVYGYLDGHKPLSSEDEYKRKREIKGRIERIETYAMIVYRLEEVDIKKGLINKRVHDYNANIKPKLEEAFTEYEAFRNDNESVILAIKNVPPKEIQNKIEEGVLQPIHLDAYNLGIRVTQLETVKTSLEVQIRTFYGDVIAAQNEVNSLWSAADLNELNFDPEKTRRIRELTSIIPDKIQSALAETESIDDNFKKLDADLTAILSSDSLKSAVLGTITRVEEIERDRENQKFIEEWNKNRAAGRLEAQAEMGEKQQAEFEKAAQIAKEQEKERLEKEAKENAKATVNQTSTKQTQKKNDKQRKLFNS